MNPDHAELILTRTALVDFLEVGDESLVLTEAECLRLTPVPTSLLRYLDEPRTMAQAVHHLEDSFGPAPPERMKGVISDLISHGLIVSPYADLPEDEPAPPPDPQRP